MKNAPTKVVDLSTGEKLSIETATNEQIGEFLYDIESKIKPLKKMEKAIKEYIKSERLPEFENVNEKEIGTFANWKLTRSYVSRFNEKRLLEKGTEEEKRIWAELKEKYSVLSSQVKFS